MGLPEATRLKQADPNGVAAHRVRRGLIAFGTSIALVLGVLGVFGTATASAAPRTGLAVSLNADRSKATRLNSLTVHDNIYVFVRGMRGLKKVTFYLDDSRRSGSPVRTEFVPPFDLGGTASDGSAYPFDTATLADGPHTITAVLKWSYGAKSVRRASFTVDNDAATTPPTSTTSPTASTTKPTTTSPTASRHHHGHADPYADRVPEHHHGHANAYANRYPEHHNSHADPYADGLPEHHNAHAYGNDTHSNHTAGRQRLHQSGLAVLVKRRDVQRR